MGSTLLAVPITHLDTPLADQETDSQKLGADLIELRVDLIGDADAVERYLRGPRRLPAILTIRSHEEGGHWDGDEADRIALFERLGMLQPGYIDVELRTWQRSANLRQKLGLVCRRLEGGEVAGATDRVKNELILSVHDFRDDSQRDALWRELVASPAPILKLALTPADATGGVELLRLLSGQAQESHAHEPTADRRAGRMPALPIVLGMGEAGLCTRVLARKFGAFLTFAAVDERWASAPGQLSISALRDLYRWDALTPATRVYGVIGWPVSHSLSPRFHNDAMRRAGIDGVYVPLPVRPGRADFDAFMSAVVAALELDFAGFSVTIPHKEHAFEWLRGNCGRMTDVARRCGAVNTLRFGPDGLWEGENTDAAGAVHALGTIDRLHREFWAGRKVAVLGAGGAARAIAAALSEQGCLITIFNRTLERAAALGSVFGCVARPWEERGAHDADVLINCTSIGLAPQVDESPMPVEGLRPGCVVFDTIYNPRETRLLREAAAAGCAVISGMEMFIGQASAQFRWWHGREPIVPQFASAGV